MDKSQQQDLLKQAEEESAKEEITDQSKYLIDQKIEVLKTIVKPGCIQIAPSDKNMSGC